MSNEPDLKPQSIDHSDLPRGVVASLGDILAQIWAAEHEDDFEKLILEVNATRKQSDYNQHRNEELVIVAAKYRLLRFEILIRIILEHLESPWNRAFARTNELIATLSPAVLAWLFCLSRGRSLMRFLVGVQIELEATLDTMISRTGEVAERQLVASFLQSNPSSIRPLLAAIQREPKKWGGPAPTKLYQPFRRADETQDRRQVALEEIGKAYHRMGDEEFQNSKVNIYVRSQGQRLSSPSTIRRRTPL